MEMTVKDERKLVEIWLTNAEKSDPVLRAGLQGIYDTYKKKKYLVAVFRVRKLRPLCTDAGFAAL